MYVSREGIAQTPKIARMKSSILDLLETPLLLSAKQRKMIACINNYANLFVVNNATLNVNILKEIKLVRKNINKITYLYETFTSKKQVNSNGDFVMIIADATEQQMAAMVINKLVVIKLNRKIHFNTTEILEPICALMALFVDINDRNLCVKTDNNTAKSAFDRNRVRLQRKQLSIDIFFRLTLLMQVITPT